MTTRYFLSLILGGFFAAQTPKPKKESYIAVRKLKLDFEEFTLSWEVSDDPTFKSGFKRFLVNFKSCTMLDLENPSKVMNFNKEEGEAMFGKLAEFAKYAAESSEWWENGGNAPYKEPEKKTA